MCHPVLPPEAPLDGQAGRGSERRRPLLNYLRAHPEVTAAQSAGEIGSGPIRTPPSPSTGGCHQGEPCGIRELFVA